MNFEDLLAEPKRSLQQMMIFLGVKPRIKRMLDKNGCLPHENEAGAMGEAMFRGLSGMNKSEQKS